MPASLRAPVLAALLAQHRFILRREHGRDVHARRVVPDEERLVCLLRVVAVEEIDDLGRDFLVDGPRAIQRQRPFVLACGVLLRAVAGLAPDDRARRGQAGSRLGIDCARHLRQAGDRCVLARRRDALHQRGLVDVDETYPLHGVEVIQVAPVFLEAVRGRQCFKMIAEVILAELAGRVAEVQQELGDRRRARAQPGRTAWQLRRDHAGAQRVHAGEEGIAPGGAALLGVIRHEDCALVADTIDVGRLAHHETAVIDGRLHPADVVTHDEQDVGFLLRERRHRRQGHGADEREHANPRSSFAAHVDLLLECSVWDWPVCTNNYSLCVTHAHNLTTAFMFNGETRFAVRMGPNPSEENICAMVSRGKQRSQP